MKIKRYLCSGKQNEDLRSILIDSWSNKKRNNTISDVAPFNIYKILTTTLLN